MVRPTEIVDIGANPIEGDPPYGQMLRAGMARVTGFEPQAEALARLNAAKGPNERYFPYIVGDGGRRTFNICRYSGLSSFLEPDREVTKLHSGLHGRCEIIEKVDVDTVRLDDIAEIQHIDFLKIDVQGAELDVFRHGRAKLARCVAVWTEVAYMPFYKDQPSFGDIDVELRSQGFTLHTILSPKRFEFGPEPQGANQLIDGDVIYVRDFRHPERMDDDQLQQLAQLSEACFGSIGLARLCREYLAARGR